MYVWIVRLLADMELRYNLSFLDLIFGDQGLDQKIMVDLDIPTTCILRCDYYHQIHEVWPHTFGTHLFQKIRGHLDRIFLGTKEEWELSYSSAKTFLLHDAEKFSALEGIYKNSSYFAGWFLETIEGNIFLCGSVPAKQNHSSVAAHLGPGASWLVVEQVSKLLDRQKHLTSKRQKKDIQAIVGNHNYKSRLQDQAGLDNEIAKKKLSKYAYSKLWLVEYKSSSRLQFIVHENVTIVWPDGKPQTCVKYVLISGCNRCTCQCRVAFNHQCRHELCIDGKFELAKYSTRWLKCKSFNEISPSINLQLSPAHHHQTPALGDDDPSFHHDFGDENNISGAGQQSGEDVTLSCLDASKPYKLSFQVVSKKASNLVRLAQSDPTTFGSLCYLLDQLTNRIRNSQSIVVQSYGTSLPSCMKKPGATPLLGTLKAAPNVTTQRRKISRHESRRQIITKTRNPLLSLVGQSNDLSVLAEPRAREYVVQFASVADINGGRALKSAR
jgi:hypothetical protein